MSNSYPFILDEGQLGRADYRASMIRREFEHHNSVSSLSRSIRPRLDEPSKIFYLPSLPGAGGDWLMWKPNPQNNQDYCSVDQLIFSGVTREAKFLFIDWHQIFDRSRAGNTHSLGRAPPECVEVARETVRLGERLNKNLFVTILSYIDSDWRVNEVLGFLNISNFVFPFVVITRQDSGSGGKAGVLRDFIKQLDLDHKQILFIDDKARYLEECRSFSLNIETLQIKLRRKPLARGHHSVGYFEDSFETIETWLRSD